MLVMFFALAFALAFVLALMCMFDKTHINSSTPPHPQGDDISSVGEYSLKLSNGYYDIFVWNYYCDWYNEVSGFHWEYIGSESNEDDAKIRAEQAAKQIKNEFAEWRRHNRVI